MKLDPIMIMEQDYIGESIVDLERDVGEALDSRYNANMDRVPQDQHGFCQGRFLVVIEWLPQ